MIRLTDKEIRQIANNNTELDSFDWDDVIKLMGLSNKTQLKKVAAWGSEYCVYHPQLLPNGSLYASLHRRQCDECWQSLLEEIKE